uniref:NADH dehydrogenase subunit 6 n=1 Tax=Simplicia rectalis TaxID=1481671 RepID=UPI001FA71E47|nr:NADH dehydrogenase subunit 6 [Simplicia rectalis]YP_010327035.1 NADH dehydrogenase subunit 6 [Simplicia niphona]ULR87020.1 NADH dehydrogenase subunit 6 [Simplicia rectalis]UNP54296.1 NADH dehydrogenase subunit 6 [Simplicia niphona]
MTKMLLSYFIIFITIFMMFLNNPLSMGLMILIQTMLICLLTGMLIKTYWFSYILFLTFMGGILVLFIYVCSIASNELFKPSHNMKLIFFFSFMMFMIMQLFWFNNLYWMNFSFNSDMNNFMINLFMNNENKINLTKLYNNQTFMIMLMLVIYLFITLIAVVKITNIFYGPIRSKI